LRRRGLVRFNLTVTVPSDIDRLSLEAVKALLVQLLSKAAEQDRVVRSTPGRERTTEGREWPAANQPSGIENASEPKRLGKRGEHRRRGQIAPRVTIEDRVIKAEVPPGSLERRRETVEHPFGVIKTMDVPGCIPDAWSGKCSR
jgi:hypothetical protein